MNYKKLLSVLTIIFCLPACTTIGVRETKIVLPDNTVYTLYIQSDADFYFKNKDAEIKIDNRGRASLVEHILQAPIVGTVGLTTNMLRDSSK